MGTYVQSMPPPPFCVQIWKYLDMKFGILPWLERGHAFTQNIKNHLFCIKIKWAFRIWGPFWRRERVELVAGQLGRVDRVDLEPLEMGAFPLRGGGIPLTRWGQPLPDGCGVPGLLPGVDHRSVSSDNLDGSREWEKGKNERITVFNTTCAVCTLTKLSLQLSGCLSAGHLGAVDL